MVSKSKSLINFLRLAASICFLFACETGFANALTESIFNATRNATRRSVYGLKAKDIGPFIAEGNFNRVHRLSVGATKRLGLPSNTGIRIAVNDYASKLGSITSDPRVIRVLGEHSTLYNRMRLLRGPQVYGAGVIESTGESGMLIELIEGRSLNGLTAQAKIKALDEFGTLADRNGFMALDMHEGNSIRDAFGRIRAIDVELWTRDELLNAPADRGYTISEMLGTTVMKRRDLSQALREAGSTEFSRKPQYIQRIEDIWR